MVDLGLNIKLQGFQKALNELKGIAGKFTGLFNRNVGVSAADKELSIAKQTLTIEEKRAALRNQQSGLTNRQTGNVDLGSQFGASVNKDIAVEFSKIKKQATDAGLKINDFSTKVKVQQGVIGSAISVLRKYGNTTARTGGLEAQLQKHKNLAAALNSTIGALKKMIVANAKSGSVSVEVSQKQKKQLDTMQAMHVQATKARDRIAALVTAQNKLTGATVGGTAAVGSFNKSISIAIGKLLRYRVAFFIIRGAINSVKQSIQEFIDIQDGLAQLRKVVDPITTSITRLRDLGFDFAKGYSRSVNEVIDTFKRWAQTGLDQIEIIEATKATLKAANAVNLDSKEVIEALTSAIFAYKIEASDATSVVDKWIAVQASFPVTAQDLLRGLETIGVAAKDFGVTIDALNGQIAAISSVTRKSGKAVAQSLKTIFARIPRKETIKAFQAVGVAVVAEGNKFRAFDDIIGDLADKWSELSDEQQKNIAQVAGGIRRYVDFIALLNNFETAQNATAISLGAGGASARAAGIQLATMKSKIEGTRAAFQQLGFALGEELAKPLSLVLKGLNSFISTLLKADPVWVQWTATVITAVSAFLLTLTVLKGLGFILSLVTTKLLFQSSAQAISTGETIAGIGAMEAYHVAATGVAASSGAAAVGITAVGTASKIALRSLNIIVAVLSVIAGIWAFSAFEAEGYEATVTDTTKSIATRAKEIFRSIKSIQDQEKILKDNIDKRAKALEGLAASEGKADKASQQRFKANQRILKDANAVIAQDPVSADIIREAGGDQTKNLDAQNAAQLELATRAKIVEANFKAQIEPLSQAFDIMQAQREITQENIKETETAIKTLRELTSGNDEFLVFDENNLELGLTTLSEGLEKSAATMKIFGDAAKKAVQVELPDNLLSAIQRINKEIAEASEGNIFNRLFGGGEASFEVTNLKSQLRIVRAPIAKLREQSEIAGNSIEQLASVYKSLKSEILGIVSPQTFVAVNDELEKIEATHIGGLEGLRKRFDDLTDALENGSPEAENYKEKLLKLSASLVSFGATARKNVGDLVAGGLAASSQELIGFQADLNALSYENAILGAEALGDDVEEAVARMHDFLQLDLDKTFVKQFENISRTVKAAGATVDNALSLKGTTTDAKTRAIELQGIYISALKGVGTVTNNLNTSLSATDKQLAELAVTLEKVKLLEFESTLVTDKILELTQKKINLQRQLKEITESTTKNEAEANLRKISAELIKISSEEAGRVAAIDRINFSYDSQVDLAKAVGKTNIEVLRIQGARIRALGIEKVEQEKLKDTADTLVNIQKIQSKTMLEIAENARKITLAKALKEMKEINALSKGIETALASSFAGITKSITEGSEQRHRVSEEIREAEFDLQEASKKGDEEAILRAKLKLKELQADLKEFRSLLFEIQEFGKNLFEGVGNAVNDALSKQLAEDVIDITVNGKSIGEEIAESILGVNGLFIGDYKNATQAVLDANKALNDSFILGLTSVFKNAVTAFEIAELRKFKTPDISAEGATAIDNKVTDIENKRLVEYAAEQKVIQQKMLEAGYDARISGEAAATQAQIDAGLLLSEEDQLKKVMQSGLAVLANAIAASIGSRVGGGSAAAAAGGALGGAAGKALGASLGSLGGPIGGIIGAGIGGVIGGIFGGKRKTKEFVPSIQSNTEALNNNTLAIEQLQKNVINAPSNFNVGQGFNTGNQSPSFNITVNGSGDPQQVASLVINRINKDYSRGVRTGTTRRSAL